MPYTVVVQIAIAQTRFRCLNVMKDGSEKNLVCVVYGDYPH